MLFGGSFGTPLERPLGMCTLPVPGNGHMCVMMMLLSLTRRQAASISHYL